MKTYQIRLTFVLLLLLISSISCKKFLETKSVQALSTPETLEDLQLLLDNPILQEGLNAVNTGTDEYYVPEYANWLSNSEVNKKGYTWDGDLNSMRDWSVPYQGIFYANTILFNLDKIVETENKIAINNVKGSALFIRAHLFYVLAQAFAPQYDPASASSDLGIVLRLDADFNKISKRASVDQTYQQIIKDLEEALNLLSEVVPLYKNRPGKSACRALLARVYLQLGNYQKAKEHADICLNMPHNLVDYNDKDAGALYPMGDFNKNTEILYYFKTSAETPLNGDEPTARIDSNLYKSFGLNDLRKYIFFKDNGDQTHTFKGSYTGTIVLFNGIAIDEVYLIRAECNARLNNASAAMNDLNVLLEKRWVRGAYVPYVNLSAEQILPIILQERKKELLNRGIRWSDLKRLNKDGRFALTLKRNLNGQIYQLSPNDFRYTILLPFQIITLTNLPQNPR